MALEIEIHTANAPDGEPLVVVKLDAQVTILTLTDAADIARALTEAAAKSVITDAVAPVEKSLIHIPE